jgi:hypothetical protein
MRKTIPTAKANPSGRRRRAGRRAATVRTGGLRGSRAAEAPGGPGGYAGVAGEHGTRQRATGREIGGVGLMMPASTILLVVFGMCVVAVSLTVAAAAPSDAGGADQDNTNSAALCGTDRAAASIHKNSPSPTTPRRGWNAVKAFTEGGWNPKGGQSEFAGAVGASPEFPPMLRFPAAPLCPSTGGLAEHAGACVPWAVRTAANDMQPAMYAGCDAGHSALTKPSPNTPASAGGFPTRIGKADTRSKPLSSSPVARGIRCGKRERWIAANLADLEDISPPARCSRAADDDNSLSTSASTRCRAACGGAMLEREPAERSGLSNPIAGRTCFETSWDQRGPADTAHSQAVDGGAANDQMETPVGFRPADDVCNFSVVAARGCRPLVASGVWGGLRSAPCLKSARTALVRRSNRDFRSFERATRTAWRLIRMAFEIVVPGTFNFGGIAAGECSIGKSGTLTARFADLILVGVGNYAIVLVDTSTRRIAVRGPRDGEQANSVSASIIPNAKKQDSGRRKLNISRALRRLGLDASAVAGRYELHRHENEFAFVVLDEVRYPPVAKPYIPPVKSGAANVTGVKK